MDELTHLISTVATLTIRISTLEDEVRKLKKVNADLNKSDADVNARCLHSNSTAPTATVDEANATPNSQSSVSAQTEGSQKNADRVIETINDNQSTSSLTDTESEESFVEQRLQKRRKRRKEKRKKRDASEAKRNAPQGGLQAASNSRMPESEKSLAAADDHTQKDVRSKKTLYLGNVKISCTAQDICDHLQKYGVHIKPQDAQPLAKGPTSSSYRVEVPSANLATLISDVSIWPKGIKVREFSPTPLKNHNRSNKASNRNRWNANRERPHQGRHRQGHRQQYNSWGPNAQGNRNYRYSNQHDDWYDDRSTFQCDYPSAGRQHSSGYDWQYDSQDSGAYYYWH